MDVQHVLYVFHGLIVCFLFSLFVNNVRSVPMLSETHNIKYKPQRESFVCGDLYPHVDRLFKMYSLFKTCPLLFSICT